MATNAVRTTTTLPLHLTYAEARDMYRGLRAFRMMCKRKDYGADFVTRIEWLEEQLVLLLDKHEAAMRKRDAVSDTALPYSGENA